MKSNLKLALLLIIGAWVTACHKNKNQEKINTDQSELTQISPKGQKGPSETFTGNAYHIGLIDADSVLTTAVGNVYFEPGARSNWHSHPSGQILIITDGRGYHQIEGQPIEIIKKGDVVKCPPNVRHWHGASPEEDLQQLYIIPNTEKGMVEWMQKVTDEEYNRTK